MMCWAIFQRRNSRAQRFGRSGLSSPTTTGRRARRTSSFHWVEYDGGDRGNNMTKRTLSIIAAVLAIAWSSAALAVYQETEVKVTDQGKPVPEQTVTLTVKEKDPKQPDKPPKVIREVKYKAKTNRDGKIVVKLDDK